MAADTNNDHSLFWRAVFITIEVISLAIWGEPLY
jgi:hypothetical protein